MRFVTSKSVRLALFAAAFTVAGTPAWAFFPPINPTDPPVTITRPPTIDPVRPPVVVPVDPQVKPPTKPRPPKQCCDCVCDPNTGTQNTPEPATMISAGLGAGCLGLWGLVKRRRSRGTSAA